MPCRRWGSSWGRSCRCAQFGYDESLPDRFSFQVFAVVAANEHGFMLAAAEQVGGLGGASAVEDGGWHGDHHPGA